MRGQPNVSTGATWWMYGELIGKVSVIIQVHQAKQSHRPCFANKKVPIWASWDWFAYFDIICILESWNSLGGSLFLYRNGPRPEEPNAKHTRSVSLHDIWFYIRKLLEDLECLFVNLLCFFNFTKKQFQLSAKVSRTCCFSTVSCLKHNTSRTACS